VLKPCSGSKTNHLMLCRKIPLFAPRAIQNTEIHSGDKIGNFEILNIVLYEKNHGALQSYATGLCYRVMLHKGICQGI
jgi:hypothetical protein